MTPKNRTCATAKVRTAVVSTAWGRCLEQMVQANDTKEDHESGQNKRSIVAESDRVDDSRSQVTALDETR